MSPNTNHLFNTPALFAKITSSLLQQKVYMASIQVFPMPVYVFVIGWEDHQKFDLDQRPRSTF